MLVLNRKVNESLKIGDDIEVKVIAVEGDQVKIGIAAPKHIDIHRQEVYEKITEENKEAIQAPAAWLDMIKNGDKTKE
ncbi:carbon storage regulator CsrA [Thalassobacillus devorans]|uniref:carbon storage regulator CsrA n=1 Tax=Thalassobacillus devorans TaxID=279813 RepID=UPI00048C0135|nr:carbon storage regulator CsrA [Thalassobacillus devorans]